MSKEERRVESRRQELLEKGLTEEQAQATLEAEEFRRMPIDQRINVVMDILGNVQRVYREAIQSLADEMVALHDNQEAIADSFDINLRGLEKILLSLGVSEETQKSVMEKVTEEFLSEKAAREAKLADMEKSIIEGELKLAQEESSPKILV